MTPEDLVELEAIKRVKYAYARCLDLKLWDEIATLFTEDAVAAYSGGGYTFEGREAIVDFLTRSMGAETFHSSHKMHHPEIELTGPETATGVWALDDTVDRHAVEHHDPGRVVLRRRVREARRQVADQAHVVPAGLRGAAAARQRRGPVAHGVVVGHRRQEQAPRGLTRYAASGGMKNVYIRSGSMRAYCTPESRKFSQSGP